MPIGEKVPNFLLSINNGLSAVGGVYPGESSRLFQWNDFPKFAIAICYEITNGLELRKAVRNGAKLILSVANLDPYPKKIHNQFLSLSRMRSIENNRDTVIASNTGPSSHINSEGRIEELLVSNKEQYKVFFPKLSDKSTFYCEFGEMPMMVIFLILILLNIFYYKI